MNIVEREYVLGQRREEEEDCGIGQEDHAG